MKEQLVASISGENGSKPAGPKKTRRITNGRRPRRTIGLARPLQLENMARAAHSCRRRRGTAEASVDFCCCRRGRRCWVVSNGRRAGRVGLITVAAEGRPGQEGVGSCLQKLSAIGRLAGTPRDKSAKIPTAGAATREPDQSRHGKQGGSSVFP